MSSRIDSLQVALPRTVDAQQQQHAVARQPAVAQEQAAAAVQQTARQREQRPETVERRQGARVERDEVLPVLERDAGLGRRRQEDAGASSGSGRHGEPERQAPGRPPRAQPGAPPGAQLAPKSAVLPPDGKGSRVDIRL